jgi:hypothetical protein
MAVNAGEQSALDTTAVIMSRFGSTKERESLAADHSLLRLSGRP